MYILLKFIYRKFSFYEMPKSLQNWTFYLKLIQKCRNVLPILKTNISLIIYYLKMDDFKDKHILFLKEKKNNTKLT